MRFRLVWYDSNTDSKYDAAARFEYLGSCDAIWHLWFLLSKTLGKRHVEVFNLAGERQQPQRGVRNGMTDYSV